MTIQVWKPTHLLYEASRNTYHDVEEVLANFPTKQVHGHCALCGSEIEEGALSKDVLSNNFTDTQYFYVPYSDYMCKACTYCLRALPEDGNKNKRRFITNSVLATPSGTTFFDKKAGIGWVQIMDTLWNPPKDEPYMLLVPRVGQKHMSYRAKVNYSSEVTYVQYEAETIVIVQEEHYPLWLNLLELRKNEVPCGTVKTGQWTSVDKKKKFGEVWEMHKDEIQKWWNTAEFLFLLDLSGKYLKNGGIV